MTQREMSGALQDQLVKIDLALLTAASWEAITLHEMRDAIDRQLKALSLRDELKAA